MDSANQTTGFIFLITQTHVCHIDIYPECRVWQFRTKDNS